MKYYKYHISGSAHRFFPAETHFGIFTLEDNSKAEIPQEFPFGGAWGISSVDNVTINDNRPVPVMLELVYLSIVESKFYGFSLPINASEISRCFEQISGNTENEQPMKLVVGMAPYGKVALWIGIQKKQILLGWLKSNEISVRMDDFLPQKPEISIEEYCKSYIISDMAVKKRYDTNSILDSQIFDNYMKQFSYRYLVLLKKWKKDEEKWEKYADDENVPVFDFIEESLYDGTHDKLHDGGLMKYHQAGKPKKLRVEWHIGKSEYSAYFWFEDERIREVFDRFYGAHPDTKTDFIIRIDAEKRKYELALYRYGLKEPQVIPEDVYQLLVFKNKFEDYRSANYNQQRGAWIW